MSKLFNIVKSRFIKGENLPNWYEHRLQICSVCPLNSKNIEDKDKSSVRKGWELIAGAHCTDPSCGCTVTEKAKIEEETCPKSYWKSIDKPGISRKLNISATSNKADFSYEEKTKSYLIDYGVIPYQFDSSFDIIITDKGIAEITTTTSCGCTTANPKYSKNGVEIEIKYDTLRVGVFSKSIRLNYKNRGIRESIMLKIKGQVKNP